MKLSLSIGALYSVKCAFIDHLPRLQLPPCNSPGIADVTDLRHTIHNLCPLEMDEKRVKAILFDLDNTLIETRWAGEVAIQKVIMSHLNLHFYATRHVSFI